MLGEWFLNCLQVQLEQGPARVARAALHGHCCAHSGVVQQASHSQGHLWAVESAPAPAPTAAAGAAQEAAADAESQWAALCLVLSLRFDAPHAAEALEAAPEHDDSWPGRLDDLVMARLGP